MHKIINVEVLDHYNLNIDFEDGKKYSFNVEPYLFGEVFEPLKNKEIFNKVTIDKDLGTIVWPTGADFCPDNLYSEMQKNINKKLLV